MSTGCLIQAVGTTKEIDDSEVGIRYVTVEVLIGNDATRLSSDDEDDDDEGSTVLSDD